MAHLFEAPQCLPIRSPSTSSSRACIDSLIGHVSCDMGFKNSSVRAFHHCGKGSARSVKLKNSFCVFLSRKIIFSIQFRSNFDCYRFVLHLNQFSVFIFLCYFDKLIKKASVKKSDFTENKILSERLRAIFGTR